MCEHTCARGDKKPNCGAKFNKGIKGQFTEKETEELQSCKYLHITQNKGYLFKTNSTETHIHMSLQFVIDSSNYSSRSYYSINILIYILWPTVSIYVVL